MVKPTHKIYFPSVIENLKGNVRHFIKRQDISKKSFGEIYFSEIRVGQIKAWKCHTKITSHLCVLLGEVKFVIYSDDQKITELFLSSQRNCRLMIYPNTWYGFSNIGNSDAVIVSYIDKEHDPKEQLSMDIKGINYDW